ncbi:MAG TPA: hypothetical protein ENG03_11250 [Thioploca sp.]|nr:MAG: hypothetical protein DRR19_01595 [Gammaproteobacteria bacterium]HDN27649.1 hypothetical protein [Thioploca sp.]
MNQLSKFEIATIIAVLSATIWLGTLNGTVNTLMNTVDIGALKAEQDKFLTEIKTQKANMLAEVEQARQQAMSPAIIRELRENMAQLETRLQAVQQAMTSPQMQRFEAQIVEAETKLNQVQQTLGALQIADLQTQAANAAEKLNQLNQALRSVKAEIASVSTQASTQVKQQTVQALADIQSRKQQAVSELQPNLSRTQQQLKTIQTAVESLNVDALQTHLTAVKKDLTVLNQTVDGLKGELANAPQALTQINQQKVQALAAVQKAIEKATSDFETSLSDIEAKRLATVKKVEEQPIEKNMKKIPVMVTIPAGGFDMGRNSSNEEHWVYINNSFTISRFEITFEEYDAFAEATGRDKPHDQNWGRGNRPVINVSWHEAVAYTEWLSQLTGQTYRLPSRYEWEYAARAGTRTTYWWGEEIGKNRANCGDGCGSQWDGKQTAPVGSFSPNRFGLSDTAGNV